jgi:hypothetical protein
MMLGNVFMTTPSEIEHSGDMGTYPEPPGGTPSGPQDAPTAGVWVALRAWREHVALLADVGTNGLLALNGPAAT